MKGRFLLGSSEHLVEGNIYADKSASVLDWLLQIGVNKDAFSLREVANDRNVSVGLVQRVFSILVLNGLMLTEGVRTAKRFSTKNPHVLFRNWIDHYSIVKKCKMWTYRSGFGSREEVLAALQKSDLKSKTALALHSAAAAHRCKNTNLQTIELYMQDVSIRQKLEAVLELEPQEKGYEVLLVEPYYKSLLKLARADHNSINISPPLLTFLDLYHFPLRGIEQAEFMAERIPVLKQIYRTK